MTAGWGISLFGVSWLSGWPQLLDARDALLSRVVALARFSPLSVVARGLLPSAGGEGLGEGLRLQVVVVSVAPEIRPRLATTAPLGGVILVRPLAVLIM